MKVLIHLTIAAITSTVLSTEVGATSWRACSHDAGGPLDESDIGVFTHASSFNVDGYQFGVAVKSLAQAMLSNGSALPGDWPPDQLASMCIRYQLENRHTARTMDWFRWGDANMPWYGYPIPPGQHSEDWPVQFTDVLPKAQTLPSTVISFRNNEAIIRALFAVRYKRAKPLGQTTQSASPINYLMPDKVPTALQAALQSADMEITPVEAIATPQSEGRTYRTLSYQFSPPGEPTVAFASALRYADGNFIISYKMNAADSIKVSSPLFNMLREFRPKPVVKDAITMVQYIDKFARSMGNELSFSINVDAATSEFEGYGVFLVQHPVTVRTAAGEACLLQSAYSPVPINISDRKCDLPAQIINNWDSER
jgi:hypothetical protein